MAKAFMVIAGPPGAGKSTEAATAFQKSLYIKSSPNVLHFYEQQFKRKLLNGCAMPNKQLVIDAFAINGKGTVGTDGAPVPVSQKNALEHYSKVGLGQVIAAANAGQPKPFEHVIVDEAGTFLNRVFMEILPMCLTEKGKINPLQAFKATGDWASKWTDFLRQFISYDVGVTFITHDQEPDAASGKKGGPKFPSQGIMRQICADADGVLLRMIEDAKDDNIADLLSDEAAAILAAGESAAKREIDVGITKGLRRIWVAHASKIWVSKMRGISDADYERIKDMALADIMKLSGFDV